MRPGRLLVVIAIVLFVLAAAGVNLGIALVPLGLAAWAASELVP